jgi:hypothetical protein
MAIAQRASVLLPHEAEFMFQAIDRILTITSAELRAMALSPSDMSKWTIMLVQKEFVNNQTSA